MIADTCRHHVLTGQKTNSLQAIQTHSPILVARLVPVEVTLLQDDVLASFDQTQVVRLGAREVVQRHHHHLVLLVVVIIFVQVVVVGGRRERRRGSPLKNDKMLVWRDSVVVGRVCDRAVVRCSPSRSYAPLQESGVKASWKLVERNRKQHSDL